MIRHFQIEPILLYTSKCIDITNVKKTKLGYVYISILLDQVYDP